jgi:hypothetical protein
MRVSVGPLLLGAALMLNSPARALSQPAPADPLPPAAAEPEAAEPDAAKDDSAEDSAPTKGRLLVTAKGAGGAAIDAMIRIDTKDMGELEDGEMTFANIPPGRHAIAISAAGYVKLEQEVTIRAGEQARVDARLVAVIPPSKRVWKWTLAGSAALLGLGVLYGIHGHDRMLANRDAVVVIEDENADHSGFPAFDFDLVEPSDCGKSAAMLSQEKHAIVTNQDRFDRMCEWQTRSLIGYGVAGVGLAGVLVSVIMLTRHGEPVAVAPGQRRGRNPEIEIVPRMTADGGGVSLSVAW